MGRKRIKTAPQSDSDESFDEEEARAIYSKKTYVPGLPTDLETIFEQTHSGDQEDQEVSATGRGRRKCFTEASNLMTRVPRRLETKYWLEDKNKDKRRKSMVAKLLKGRKKLKFRGLTLAQEENFHAMLDSLDTLSPIKCDKLSSDENNSDAKADEVSSDNSVKNSDSSIVASADVRQEELKLVNEETDTPSVPNIDLKSFEGLDWAPLPKTPVVNKDIDKKATKARRESRKSVRRASSLFKSIKAENTPENKLVVPEPIAPLFAADVPEIELAKQIQEADSIFGPIGFDEEEEGNRNQMEAEERNSSLQTKEDVRGRSGKSSLQTFSRRSSLQTTQKFKVRRSSRFFRQNNTEAIVGAIYQELTYTVRKKEYGQPDSNLVMKEDGLISGQTA